MKETKRILAVLLAVLLLTSIIPTALAADNTDVKVKLDGNYIVFDTQPCLIGGRTMVPLRTIFEALGATVSWDDSTKTVTSYNESYLVKCTIGKNEIYVNNEIKTMDIAPMIIDGRTLVPARFIAEAFSCKVEWDATTLTVNITSSPTDYSQLEQDTTQIPSVSSTESTNVETPSTPKGTLQNPYSATDGATITYQEWSHYPEKKVSIKCTNVIRGSRANTLADSENSFNDKPNESQEWCFLEFNVKYVSTSGASNEILEGSDIIYDDTFFSATGSSLNVADMATLGKTYRGYGVFDTEFYPGASGKVVIGILIPKNCGDIFLRVPHKSNNTQTWINCTSGSFNNTTSNSTISSSETSSSSSISSSYTINTNCYSGTNIPTYTQITGINLKSTGKLDSGKTYYVYPDTKHGKYSESVDYAGYFMEQGWTEIEADNENSRYFTMSFYNRSTNESILIMTDFKLDEVCILPN